MIISDEEAQGRLDSSENLASRLVEVRKIREGGRRLGNTNVPPALRSLIGSIAVQGEENQSDIARAFGVSQPSISGYANGLIGDRRESEIEEAIEKVEERKQETAKLPDSSLDEAHQMALNVMMKSLTGLGEKLADEEIMKSMKPKEVSRIASDMSKIVSVATGQDKQSSVVNNTKVIVYAPQQRKETSYEIIDA